MMMLLAFVLHFGGPWSETVSRLFRRGVPQLFENNCITNNGRSSDSPQKIFVVNHGHVSGFRGYHSNYPDRVSKII